MQPPPDQAAMPMPAYLLYTLGIARDRRAIGLWQHVVARIDTSEEALRDMHAGTFAYVDAVCFGEGRLADPTTAPLARAAHSELALPHGRDLGDDPASWEAACQRQEPVPAMLLDLVNGRRAQPSHTAAHLILRASAGPAPSRP